VVLNGALNFSVLDGWWAEAYDSHNGFAVGKGHIHVSDQIADHRDAQWFYEELEQKVVPTYYHRDIDGLPRQWIRMMMNSIASLAWRFSADRMVMDYTRACYVPAAGGLSCEMSVK
jgi:starch phosphorylase